MLNVAMVLMIFAGVLGLPAAACSTACAGMGTATGAHSNPQMAGGQSIMEALMWLAVLASLGSILVGSLVRVIGKIFAGTAAIGFAMIFGALLLQANVLGIPSAVMLLLAAIMIFVAPRPAVRSIPHSGEAA